MGLGSRHASHHSTVAALKLSMDTSIYHVFKIGQRVMTIDAVPGQVTAILEGPLAGDVDYEVTLDNRLGMGRYTEGQLTAVGQPVTSSETHTADRDYPELGTILFDRPPIERQGTAGRSSEDEPQDPTSLADPFAWAGDETDFHDVDLSRQLPGTPTGSGPVQMPPGVDPNWKR